MFINCIINHSRSTLSSFCRKFRQSELTSCPTQECPKPQYTSIKLFELHNFQGPELRKCSSASQQLTIRPQELHEGRPRYHHVPGYLWATLRNVLTQTCPVPGQSSNGQLCNRMLQTTTNNQQTNNKQTTMDKTHHAIHNNAPANNDNNDNRRKQLPQQHQQSQWAGRQRCKLLGWLNFISYLI